MPVPSVSVLSSVATMPPTRLQRRLAHAVVTVLAIALAVTVPFAQVQFAPVTSFVPTVEGIIFVTDLLTAILLVSQFPALRLCSLLVLASGYLYTALVVALHALSFPGAFAPAGLLGGGPQATPWLYTFWRFGFAVTVIAYAWTKGGKDGAGRQVGAAPAAAIGWSVAIVFALLLVTAAVVTVGERQLPVLVSDGRRFSPLSPYVAMATLAVSILGLILLWARQTSLLDLSLTVVTWAFVAELAVNAFIITTRYSVGFYASRAFSLVTSVIVLALLVSEIARLYARLVRANALLERERENRLMNIEAATSAIVHEIRQPLTAMSLNAGAAQKFLDMRPPDHARASAAVSGLVDNTQRTAEILDAIRALFGKTAGQPERIDMNEIALEALRSARSELNEHGITVVPELTTALPPVDGRRVQLQEVLLNLVRNAIEAMQATADHSRMLRVVTARRDHDTIVVRVADSGPGIAPEQLDRIFDAFVTTKSHGRGLGLAICRTIVDRHGGQLIASSGRNGALFEVILPVGRTGEAPARASQPE